MVNLKPKISELIKSGKTIHVSAYKQILDHPNGEQLLDFFLSKKFTQDTISLKDIQNFNRKLGNSTRPILSSQGNVKSRFRQEKLIVKTKRSKEVIPSNRTHRITKTDKSQISPSNHIINTSLDDLNGLNNYQSQLEVIKNYVPTKGFLGGVEDIVGYFQNRFDQMKQFFRSRYDITDLTTVSRLEPEVSNVSVIGMVSDKKFSFAGGGSLILDDPSSEQNLNVIIPKSNPELVEVASKIINDSVICVVGYIRSGTFIAKEILLPDIPLQRTRNFAKKAIHVAFLSDIHVGSKNFMDNPMKNFIKFLNGNYGSKKLMKLAEQTKYVLFSGDVVDGVGIYPNQIDDLAIDSIKDQYQLFSEFVENIPEDVQVVVIPGNHDMVRPAEPQPQIEAIQAPILDRMENVHLLSNPSQIAIHDVEVLLYHCTSVPDIVNHVPGLSINRPVEVMKNLLKARHLAPLWGSRTPIAAEKEDHLVINQIPDVFHGGHIHINGEGRYNGVNIVNSGTMQKQTSFQKSMNILPTPGQVSIMNLKDHKLSRLNMI